MIGLTLGLIVVLMLAIAAIISMFYDAYHELDKKTFKVYVICQVGIAMLIIIIAIGFIIDWMNK